MPTQIFTDSADTVTIAQAGDFWLGLLGGNDFLTINQAAANVTALLGEDNDRLVFRAGHAAAYGESGADRFDLYASGFEGHGGSDADIFFLFAGGDATLFGDGGNDRFDFVNGGLGLLVHGGDGDDFFSGYARQESGSLFGDDGNDVFRNFQAAPGAVLKLFGGMGDDVFRVDPVAAGTIVEFAGQGIDTVEVARGASYTLALNLDNLMVVDFATVAGPAVLTGNGGANIMSGSDGDETMNGLGGVDKLFASGGADHLDGGSARDFLDGGDGNDSLFGGLGNDTLQGHLGDDDMHGGVGADFYFVDSAADSVVEAAGEGTDTVSVALADYDIPDNVENAIATSDANLVTIHGNGLANDITASPGGFSDTLTGDVGNDILRGGSNDHMSGGVGDDTYYDNTAFGEDMFIAELAGEGTDTVYASAHPLTKGTNIIYDLQPNVENCTLLFGAEELGSPFEESIQPTYSALIGNPLDNILTGCSTMDQIAGNGGNDTIFGNDGDDTLTGGGGNDAIHGGAGADIIRAGLGKDMLWGDAGADLFQFFQLAESHPAGATFQEIDAIQDYELSVDRIDLSAIDANANQSGDQAFNLVASPTGVAGQLWINNSGSGLFSLNGDVDGNGSADFVLFYFVVGSGDVLISF